MTAPWWDTTVHWLEWQNKKQKQTKKPITPSAGEDAEQLQLSPLAGGNVRWYRHSRKGLQILIELNMQLP